MEGRYERWQRPRPASRPGDVRVQAARKRRLPQNYAGRQNLTGLGSPCGRKCSEMRPDHSQIPGRYPPKHRPRNGLMYTTPARKGYVHSVSKRTPEKSYRRTARQSTPLTEVTPDLDCSDGPTPAQRGSPRLRG